MQEANWPNFLCIGAIKAGTTWLHACIAEHPDIFSPPTKEIEYFNNRYDQGATWYTNFFSKSDGRVAGESTPGYFHDPRCAARIQAANPNIRLILCLRNPVDRAFSHFLMDQRASNITEAQKLELFDQDVLENTTKYTQYGLYAEQLRPYLNLFSPDQFHYVWFEDITADPQGLISDVYDFLGVDRQFCPSILRKKVNQAAKYRNLAAFQRLRMFVQAAEKSPLSPLILKLKTNGVRDRVLGYFRKPESGMAMLPGTRKRLVEFYQKPNIELEKILNVSLDRWN